MSMDILLLDPFVLPQNEKKKTFMPYIKKAIIWHYNNNKEFRKMCDNRKFMANSKFSVDQIPYFPVSLFKTFSLLSVSESKIIKTLYSSSTSGKPSKILLDRETVSYQQLAVRKILSDFLGKTRRNFIIFDTEQVIRNTKDGELSSRATAIRGMIPIAKKMNFILNDNLEIDVNRIKKVFDQPKDDEPVCFFGFTWLMYSVLMLHKNHLKIERLLKEFKSKDKKVLHIGGWKKLSDQAVPKIKFNKKVAQFLDVSENNIIDFYGMTEQLGTVYLDCEYGYKHVPVYSEVLIRDIKTLECVENNKEGFIQLISPLPVSYPGISILSDDIGKIRGIDNCKCGRLGKYFTFERRSEKAELKGCGDTLHTKYGEDVTV